MLVIVIIVEFRCFDFVFPILMLIAILFKNNSYYLIHNKL